MKRIFLVILFAGFSILAGAQALKGSYFLDSSMNRHELNPAFAPRANYFQMLGIGNMGFGFGTNLEVPTFLYPSSEGLLTFLHPSISVQDFDKALPKNPHLDLEFSTTLFGFGFYTKKHSYWTFDTDIRFNLDSDLPRDLFMFIKKGTSAGNQTFNIGNLNVYAMAGLQASLGYSRDIIKGLRVGAKARVIAPLAYAALNIEKLSLSTSQDKWGLTTEGYAHAALTGLDLSIPEGEFFPTFEFDPQRMLSNRVIAGLGYSFDLGVEYVLELGTVFDGLSVSAAVTDLGRISYKQDAVSSFKTGGHVEWAGFQDVSMDNFDAESTLNQFVEEAKNNLLNLSEMDNEKGFTRSTMPRVHAGIEVPFLKRSMSVGLLYSARMSHSYTRQELTVSYNLTPCKWFALGLNYSFLNASNTVGAVLELTPRIGPALYVGCDYVPVVFAPAPFVPVLQMLPTSLRLNLNFGVALHLGGKTTKPEKKNKKK